MGYMGAYLIPITAVAGSFAVAIVAMILKSQARERKHKERMLLLEKGVDIPKELYDVPEEKPRSGNGFKGSRAWLLLLGTICLVIGVSVIIVMTVRQGFHEGVFGLIPLFIGIGFIGAERMIRSLIVGKD